MGLSDFLSLWLLAIVIVLYYGNIWHIFDSLPGILVTNGALQIGTTLIEYANLVFQTWWSKHEASVSSYFCGSAAYNPVGGNLFWRNILVPFSLLDWINCSHIYILLLCFLTYYTKNFCFFHSSSTNAHAVVHLSGIRLVASFVYSSIDIFANT